LRFVPNWIFGTFGFALTIARAPGYNAGVLSKTETNTRRPVSLTLAEHLTCNEDYAGSIPVTGSTSSPSIAAASSAARP
jgi:hypothetical protein